MSSAHCYMLKNGKYLPAGQAPLPIKVPHVKSTSLGSKIKNKWCKLFTVMIEPYVTSLFHQLFFLKTFVLA
jgi:hypothetical protein